MTGQIRNPQLREALKTYANDAIEAIRSHDWGPDGFPTLALQKASITDGGMTSYSAVEIDWPRILFSRAEEFHQLKTYAAAAVAIRADAQAARHLDTTVGDGQRMSRLDVTACLRSFLFWLLADQQSVVFADSKFDRLYCEMEDYFYSDTLRRSVVAPLTDFGMETNAIALGDGLSIARLSSAEREEFASRSFLFPLPPFGILGPTGWEEFALEFYVEVKSDW